MATIVAIVLGLAVANFLNKFSKTIMIANWRRLGWFFSLWCLILLIVLLGFFWSFWRTYNEIDEISIWEFILIPFFVVVCFFLSSVFLPIPEDANKTEDPSEYFIESRKPFFITLALLWLNLNIAPLIIGFDQSAFEIIAGWLMVIISLCGIFTTTIRMHKVLLIAWSTTFLSQEAVQIAIGSI